MISFLVVLIVFSAFLAASETALFSLSHTTLRSYRVAADRKQQKIASLMAHPRNVLVTILMMNMLVNLFIQNTAANLFPGDNWVLIVGVPLILTLVFGEVLPKSIALANNTRFASIVVTWIDFATRVLKPIREPLTKVTNGISRLLFFFLKKEDPLSIEELRHLVQSSEKLGILLSQECDLIEGSLNLQQSTVRERMRPREEILYYDIQDPISQLEHLFVDLELTRVPVCDGNLENLLGILSVKRYFFHRNQPIISILKKTYFVPETTKAWGLLNYLRAKDESLAVVVDEYGSISGLITQEDLIEAVVGEIRDRRDPKSLYTLTGKDVMIASGKLELSEFKDVFGIALKSKENIVTLGGWIVEQLGEIPLAGTKYATDDFLFYILSAEPNRIRRIYVRCLK